MTFTFDILTMTKLLFLQCWWNSGLFAVPTDLCVCDLDLRIFDLEHKYIYCSSKANTSY